MNSNTKSSLVSLPDHIVEEIIEYMSFEDRLSLRLSCRYFYNVCNSKLLFEKAQIKLKTLKRSHICSFEQLMESFGHLVKLNVEQLESGKIKLIAPHLGYVQDMCINYKDLKLINSHALNLKRLTVQYDLKHKVDKEMLKNLQNLIYLKAFKLEVVKVVSDIIYLERLSCLKSLLIHTLENVSSIEEIELNNVYVIGDGRKSTRKDKEKSQYLGQLYQTLGHIKHWKFINFYTQRYVTLPATILSLKCHGNENDVFLKFADLNHLEKLVVCWVNFRQFKAFQFENLKYLELEHCCLWDIRSSNQEPIRNNILQCPNFEILKLKQTYLNLRFFRGNSEVFKSSLRELTLESLSDIDDDAVGMILQVFEALRKLTLTDLKNVTSNFVNSQVASNVNLKVHSCGTGIARRSGQFRM